MYDGFRNAVSTVNSGDRLSSEFINKIVNNLLLKIRGGKGINVINRGGEIFINKVDQQYGSVSSTPPTTYVIPAQINSMDSSNLYCTNLINSELITVLKPYHLQEYWGTKTLYNGNIVDIQPDPSHPGDVYYLYRKETQYFHDIDESSPPIFTSIERVNPMWEEDEIITVGQYVDLNTNTTKYLDLNAAGRNWEVVGGATYVETDV